MDRPYLERFGRRSLYLLRSPRGYRLLIWDFDKTLAQTGKDEAQREERFYAYLRKLRKEGQISVDDRTMAYVQALYNDRNNNGLPFEPSDVLDKRLTKLELLEGALRDPAAYARFLTTRFPIDPSTLPGVAMTGEQMKAALDHMRAHNPLEVADGLTDVLKGLARNGLRTRTVNAIYSNSGLNRVLGYKRTLGLDRYIKDSNVFTSDQLGAKPGASGLAVALMEVWKREGGPPAEIVQIGDQWEYDHAATTRLRLLLHALIEGPGYYDRLQRDFPELVDKCRADHDRLAELRPDVIEFFAGHRNRLDRLVQRVDHVNVMWDKGTVGGYLGLPRPVPLGVLGRIKTPTGSAGSEILGPLLATSELPGRLEYISRLSRTRLANSTRRPAEPGRQQEARQL